LSSKLSNITPIEDPRGDCLLCPRLVEFRKLNSQKYPDWHNAPVNSFGEETARVLIVGLAPGLKGANCTGRPFTGDFAGHLLYKTLEKYGFSKGRYDERADDGLELVDCRITNAVRCLPPENKPIAAEIAACRPFLDQQLKYMPNLKVILALGRIAHESMLTTLGVRKKDFPFVHNALHKIEFDSRSLVLVDSYHCSKYNTSTKRLTEQMFHDVFETIKLYQFTKIT
jgi:uracil-DNA glycosylase